MLLVLFDLSAAFDTTDHEILLTRLYDEVSIFNTAHQWFCSHLTDGTRHVTANQSFSEDTLLTCGVP